MYKKIILLLLFMALMPRLVTAAEIEPVGTPLRKLQRGFLNVALFPFRFSHELVRQKDVDSFIPTWVTGIGTGACYAVGRVLVGAYEMITFPIPYPANYEPVVEPEFLWEYFMPATEMSSTDTPESL